MLPIFRSQHQAELLAALYLHPDSERTVTDLAAQLQVPLTTAHREVQRLLDAGLLTGRSVGRSRLVRAATGHLAAAALTELLQLSFGPPTVLTEEFTGLPGVEEVVLFGSWAARHAGTTGPSPGDIDVLVVGSTSRATVYAAAERAQERLGLPVNPVPRTRAQWDAGDDADALVSQIRAGDHLVLPAAPHPAGHSAVPAEAARGRSRRGRGGWAGAVISRVGPGAGEGDADRDGPAPGDNR